MASGTQFWTSVRDTRIAAALGSLGVPIEIKTSLDAITGRQATLFFVGLKSVNGMHDTKQLLARQKSGALESQAPDHEFLTNLRGMINRERVMDLQNGKGFIELQQVPGTEVWQYVRGHQGLPGLPRGKAAKGFAVVTTRDIKVVAALGLVGIGLLAIEGSAGNYLYYLPQFGPPREGGLPCKDAAKLWDGWRVDKDALDPLCPFTQGMFTLWNRGLLVDAVEGGRPNILLRKKGSKRSAVVREDATDEAFQRAEEHLEGR